MNKNRFLIQQETVYSVNALSIETLHIDPLHGGGFQFN